MLARIDPATLSVVPVRGALAVLEDVGAGSSREKALGSGAAAGEGAGAAAGVGVGEEVSSSQEGVSPSMVDMLLFRRVDRRL